MSNHEDEGERCEMAQMAEEILSAVYEERRTEDGRALELAHGRRLTVARGERSLELTSEAGEVELRVEITSAGPVLRFSGAAGGGGKLSLRHEGDLELEADDLTLRARGEMRLESGDFHQQVDGGHELTIRDDSRVTAQAIDLEAETGDLSLRANDDVAMDGLRVLMNVPSEEDVRRKRAEAKTIEQVLELPFVQPDDAGRLPRSLPRKRSDGLPDNR